MSTRVVESVHPIPARAAATAAARYPERVAFRYWRDGEWRTQTFAEVGETVDELARGLMALGLERGDRIAILADTRPEWTLVSLAISRAGGVVVPMYPTNSPAECEWVAHDSGAKMVVGEDAPQAAKIAEVRPRLADLEHVIVIEPGVETGVISLTQLRKEGAAVDREQLERRAENVLPEDLYTIIYTSGTTGPPKGAVLTQANGASVGVIVEELGFIVDGDVSYLYLPLAHAFGLTVQLASFDVGTEIVYFGGDTQNIVRELQETKPTYMPSVPRVYEKIYLAATAAFPDEQQLRRVVDLGLNVRHMQEQGQEVPRQLQFAFDQAEASVYRKVRELFGGRIAKAISGAAPIAPEILEFFYACGVPVLEGWGMTETTAVGTINNHGQVRFRTVGQPVPGVEVKIAEDGEILTRGPNVFREYWRDPTATDEALSEDGWLATGDLGSLDDDGYLSIIGRKKEVIITAGGKNITPANLENDLKASRWVSEAIMYGDRRPYPVALIALDSEQMIPWANERGLPSDMRSLIACPQTRELVLAELDRVNASYGSAEQIKKFTLLDHELTHERGELTPTLKVKRNVIYDRYADILGAMYR